MSNVFPRSCKGQLPTVSRGEGAYLYDQDGKAYLDGSGGAAVSCLGHGDAHVTEAIKAQLDNVAFAHTGFLTSDPAETLATRLAAAAPGDLSRVYIVSGGSEAMEAALKLARQYYLEIGQPERRHIIARKPARPTAGNNGATRPDHVDHCLVSTASDASTHLDIVVPCQPGTKYMRGALLNFADHGYDWRTNGHK